MSNSFTSVTSLQGLLIADMDWLTPDLAVGGDLSHELADAAGQIEWLERQGVTDIIDCRLEYSDEDLVAEVAPSIRYHHLPTDDHGGELDHDWWNLGIEIARDVAKRGGAVFVHCHMGVNRGPSLALAILFDRGMDPVSAFGLLRARRPQAYGIYASQYLRLEGRDDDADVLESCMDLEFDHDDLVATIGRIRQAEWGGCYRLTLQPPAEQPSSVTVDQSPRVWSAPTPPVGRNGDDDVICWCALTHGKICVSGPSLELEDVQREIATYSWDEICIVRAGYNWAYENFIWS